MTTFQLIHSDYKKHSSYGANFFLILFFTQGFWAVSVTMIGVPAIVVSQNVSKDYI